MKIQGIEVKKGDILKIQDNTLKCCLPSYREVVSIRETAKSYMMEFYQTNDSGNTYTHRISKRFEETKTYTITIEGAK